MAILRAKCWLSFTWEGNISLCLLPPVPLRTSRIFVPTRNSRSWPESGSPDSTHMTSLVNFYDSTKPVKKLTPPLTLIKIKLREYCHQRIILSTTL